METIKKYYRVDRSEIAFLKFIFEAYDGIATLTTVDSASGIIVLCIAPRCESVADMLLQDFKKEIMIDEL